MKKPSSKMDKIAAPQAAQLDAVRKLLRHGQVDQACRRVSELLARYPRFKPVLALAWDAEDAAGNFFTASLHALDWSTAAPHSEAALEALRDSCFAAGLPALGASAAQKLARLHDSPFEDLPPLHTPLGELAFADAVAIDLSRLYLGHGRLADAIAVLEPVDHPSAWNNRALTQFAQGEMTAALANFETNWQRDERNLFALYHVIQLRLWTGGRAAAVEHANALRQAQPLRAEDAYGQMFGLLLLGEHAAALDAWQAMHNASFWNDETETQQSACAYFAGLAALRSGNTEMAGTLFFEAAHIDPDNIDADIAAAAHALGALAEPADIHAGEFRDWFPYAWILEFQAAKGAAAQDAALKAQYGACDAHADYLATAAELGDKAVRFYALEILKTRAQSGDAAARDTLLALLTRPCGPDEVRMELDIWLRQNGYVNPAQPLPILLKSKITELRMQEIRLHAEPRDLGLPAASQARLERMHDLLRRRDLHGALDLAEQLALGQPEHATMHGHLATIKDALGADAAEVEALFRHAHVLDPDYLFAQAGLARMAARRGDIKGAQDLLTPLLGRDEYHYSDWRAILLVQRELAIAKKDMAEVIDIDQAIEKLEAQFSS